MDGLKDRKVWTDWQINRHKHFASGWLEGQTEVWIFTDNVLLKLSVAHVWLINLVEKYFWEKVEAILYDVASYIILFTFCGFMLKLHYYIFNQNPAPEVKKTFFRQVWPKFDEVRKKDLKLFLTVENFKAAKFKFLLTKPEQYLLLVIFTSKRWNHSNLRRFRVMHRFAPQIRYR